MITFKEIMNRAKNIDIPIAHIEFKADKKNPPPEPPYLIYLTTVRVRGADMKNNIKEISASIELYTDYEPDFILEKKIETTVLHDVEYQKFQTVTNEDMVQTAYEFNLIEKERN